MARHATSGFALEFPWRNGAARMTWAAVGLRRECALKHQTPVLRYNRRPANLELQRSIRAIARLLCACGVRDHVLVEGALGSLQCLDRAAARKVRESGCGFDAEDARAEREHHDLGAALRGRDADRAGRGSNIRDPRSSAVKPRAAFLTLENAHASLDFLC
jgi:hypothetical protein